MKKQQSSRLLALDILRGITIAGMMLVNNPGSWGHIYTPLQHAEWNGLTPTDLVFPFFMFIMGISTFISLRKTEFKFSNAILFKILKRTAIIFLIGLGLSWVGLIFGTYHSLGSEALDVGERLWKSATNFEYLRILGVMQRLALTYGIVSLIAIFFKHKFIPYLIASILVGYSILLWLGNGFAQDGTSILAIVDQSILGVNHMYNEFGLDPEGVLSTIPSVAHVLIGFWFGSILMNNKDNRERMLQLFIYGAILSFVGFLFSYACPINKKIWSPSYVMVTCGMAATLLSLLIWIIDVNKKDKWCRPFEAFGINPLFLYVFGTLLAVIIDGVLLPYKGGLVALKTLIFEGLLLSGIDIYLASCIFALFFVFVCWIMANILYRKKIYIKI